MKKILIYLMIFGLTLWINSIALADEGDESTLVSRGASISKSDTNQMNEASIGTPMSHPVIFTPTSKEGPAGAATSSWWMIHYQFSKIFKGVK